MTFKEHPQIGKSMGDKVKVRVQEKLVGEQWHQKWERVVLGSKRIVECVYVF